MGAISFIYNLEASKLTLNEAEESKWYSPRNYRPTVIKSVAPNDYKLKPSSSQEIKQFTNQVGEFFGNFIKEVKSTADEFIKDINSNSASGPPSPSKLFAPDGPPPIPLREERIRADREQYEMDLALAMSLSEAQERELASKASFEEPLDELANEAAALDLLGKGKSSI